MSNQLWWIGEIDGLFGLGTGLAAGPGECLSPTSVMASIGLSLRSRIMMDAGEQLLVVSMALGSCKYICVCARHFYRDDTAILAMPWGGNDRTRCC